MRERESNRRNEGTKHEKKALGIRHEGRRIGDIVYSKNEGLELGKDRRKGDRDKRYINEG